MGYYITFVFDPSKVEFDRDKLIAKFLEAGAWEEEWAGRKAYFYNHHLLSFGDYKPEALKQGMYADARFSWGSEPEELAKDLTGLLDLADRLGCRLYDGQIELWITRENIDDIAEGFLKGAENIANMFGVCKKPEESE